MPQSLACLSCHIVFSTKNRYPFLSDDLAARLFEYMGGILRAEKMALKNAAWMPDHVHLLVSLSREYSVADTVRLIKSNSSKWIHETFADLASFAWQAGYGAFSVSRSNEEQVKAYLANQKEHHRVHTFQEEFREFLRKHELEWDERYVWD